jgi:2-dehydropantoate 2-reductase
MRQDGLAHRKSEVELFAGTVLALAEKHKIDAPVNRKIYETILTMERAY